MFTLVVVAVLLVTESDAAFHPWAYVAGALACAPAGAWLFAVLWPATPERRITASESGDDQAQATGHKPDRTRVLLVLLIIALCGGLIDRTIQATTGHGGNALPLVLVITLAVGGGLLNEFGTRIPRRVLIVVTGGLSWLYLHIPTGARAHTTRKVIAALASSAAATAPVVVVIIASHLTSTPSYAGAWKLADHNITVTYQKSYYINRQQGRRWLIDRTCGDSRCAYWLWDGWAGFWLTRLPDDVWTGSGSEKADCENPPVVVVRNGGNEQVAVSFIPTNANRALITEDIVATPTYYAAHTKHCTVGYLDFQSPVRRVG